MTSLRFLAFELVAATVWSLAFLLLGLVFSSQIQFLLGLLAAAGVTAGAVAAALLLLFLAWRYARRRHFLRRLAMARIGVAELHELIRAGRQPMIIDVRSSASLRIDPRRIPDAVAIDLDELAARAGELPADRDIVVYCNCPNEVSAVRAAQWLMERGHSRVRPLAGGLDAWVAAGRPVAGAEPLDLAPAGP